MTKGEVLFIAGIIGSILLSLAMSLTYHLYTNAENRKAFRECLQVTERIIEAERLSPNTNIRVVSTPSCRLP